MYQSIASDSPAESQYMRNGKIVLFSCFNWQTCVREYYYADRVPCEIKVYTVLSVLACILATPIALLCCIPTVLSLKKTQRILESEDIPAARAAYRTYILCAVLGWLWFAIFITAALAGIVVGVLKATS